MPQTNYPTQFDRGFPGGLADNGPIDALGKQNGESNGVPFGIMLRQGSTENECLLPSAAGQQALGVSIHSHVSDLDLPGVEAVASGKTVGLLKRGRVWVRVEESIAIGDPVYFRHTATSSEQAGAFRKSADGDAQEVELTPSASDNTNYTLQVSVNKPGGESQTFVFTVTSDASATATEIANAFRTAMQGDSAFDALVDSTGTSTLVLTAKDAATNFSVHTLGTEQDGTASAGTFSSITENTAASPDSDRVDNAQWLSASTTVDGVDIALLDLSLPAVAA